MIWAAGSAAWVGDYGVLRVLREISVLPGCLDVTVKLSRWEK